MAQVCGREPKEIATLDSGGWERPTATVFMSGSTAIGTKASLNSV
jgi:hypothetical protein